MESEQKPSFTWPLAPSKPRARTPITAKPISQPPLAPLPRVPRASVPPPMVAEPVVARSVVAIPVVAQPVHVEPPPVFIAPEPEAYREPDSGPLTFEDDVSVDHGGLDTMSTFGAGVLKTRRGPNKFFVVATLLAVIAVIALIVH